MLVPRKDVRWETTRLFTSYSAVEQVMKKGGKGDWCFTVAFDGVDELEPIYVYKFKGDRIVREFIQ